MERLPLKGPKVNGMISGMEVIDCFTLLKCYIALEWKTFGSSGPPKIRIKIRPMLKVYTLVPLIL